ncbi:MAG: Ig-like domain-containing protein, partial [Bacteroidota bacterium]
ALSVSGGTTSYTYNWSNGATTQNLSGLSAGSYSVTVTDANGCSATASATVTQPAILTITGSPVVCVGATVALAGSVSGGTWTSGNTSLATIDAAGVLTGVSAGNPDVTYTSASGCTATVIATINALPAAITGTLTVSPGATTTLSNTGAGTWSSSNTTVATVNATTGVVSGVSVGTVTISFTTSTGCAATAVVSVNGITVTGGGTVCAGSTLTLSTTGTGGAWSSNNNSVATVSTGGIVTGVTAGTATITYSTGVAVGTATVTVNTAPATITGNYNVCLASTSTLFNTVAGGTWRSADTTIAKVDTFGVVSGMTLGSTTVTYTLYNGCTAIANVSVNPYPAAITGSTNLCSGGVVTLSNITSGGSWSSSSPGVVSVDAGGVVTGVTEGAVLISYTSDKGCSMTVPVTNQLSAILGAVGTCVGMVTTMTDLTAGGTWSSSNPAVASVGSTGAVTSVSGGTAVITYTILSGCYRTRAITVTSTPGPITGITEVCVGQSITLSNSMAGGVWSGLSPTYAYGPSADGVVTGIAAGTAPITYTLSPSCKVYTTVTVNPLPSSIMGTAIMCQGSSATLSNASAGGTWFIGNPLVAIANLTSGVITGTGAGTTTVTYTIMPTGCFRTATVSVNPIPAAIGGLTGLCVGGTTSLTNTTAGISWISSTPSVATVAPSSGVVSGIAAGTSTITYTLGTGCYITTVVTVNALPPAISGTMRACVGTSTTLSNAVPGGTWASNPSAVASITSGGIVSGIAVGTTMITYTAPAGCTRTGIVTINATPSAITGYPTACVGTTTTLGNSTGGGTWVSANTAVATIVSGTGVMTGVAAGTTTITYTITATGCLNVATVTVVPVPGANTGTNNVCVGSAVTLSNAQAGGSWSSSNGLVATVGTATGIVNGVATGNATITYAYGANCRATTIMTVKALPNTLAGTASVCAGWATTLSSTTGGGTWSSSNTAIATVGSAAAPNFGAVVGVSGGTVSISYTGSNACSRVATVTVNALPNTGTITGAILLHTSAINGPTSVTLAATGDAGGTWSSSNGLIASVSSSTGTVNALLPGTATITYSLTSAAGCVGRSTQAITVSASREGGNNANPVMEAGIEFSVYPNPTTGAFTVSTTEAGVFGIYTIDGKETARFNVAAGNNAIQLPQGIAAGVYMCRFTGMNGSNVMVRLVFEP